MSAARSRRKASRGGFSIVEAMIAATILLIIAIGVLPLFTRSILNNVAGNDATAISNHGKSELEQRIQTWFGAAPLTVPAGTTVLTQYDWWGSGALSDRSYRIGNTREGWWSNTPATNSTRPSATDAGNLLWTRKTEVRQYNISDLSTPLDGGADPQFVHLKQITVTLSRVPNSGGIWDNRLLGNPRITLNTLRAE